MKSTEINAEITGFKHRTGVDVTFGKDAMAGRRHHLGVNLRLTHFSFPSFACFLRLGLRLLKKLRRVGLLVASMTRISTMA